jgi:hypothetical protein
MVRFAGRARKRKLAHIPITGRIHLRVKAVSIVVEDHMKHAALLVIAVLFAAGFVRASDPIGIYTLIDRVVLEPAEGPAARIQLWGAFSFAGKPGTGDSYDPPARGYLYYAAQEGQEEVTRNEWSDLKKSAGTGKVLGFGSRYQSKGTVRSPFEKPAAPDPYPLNFGVVPVKDDATYPPVHDLLSLPVPASPPDGATRVDPGKATLVIKNAPLFAAKYHSYVFRIEDRAGGAEESLQVEAGASETSWSPAMDIRTGEAYRWKAWVVDGSVTGPPAAAEFRLYYLRGDANADGVVDLTDPVAILWHLFQSGPAPEPFEAGDANRDAAVDVSDAIRILEFLFAGGKALPPPYPEPGLNP